jgi:4-diphosphocytidyl-2-C-methyl-D-erythritol kinase
VACDALWGTGLSRDDLHALAAQLGSDVPFALYGGTAMGTGRGEQITPVLARGEFHWVFAFAHEGLSTPAVFRELDRLREDAGEQAPMPGVDEALLRALRAGDSTLLGAALRNDLTRPATSLRPDLRATLRAGRDAGAIGTLLSGSGPTCAFLASDAVSAAAVAAALEAAPTVRAVRRALGPAAGAQVL